jgi:hypothetical protein
MEASTFVRRLGTVRITHSAMCQLISQTHRILLEEERVDKKDAQA